VNGLRGVTPAVWVRGELAHGSQAWLRSPPQPESLHGGRQDAKPAVRYLEGGRWTVQGELVRRALAALIRQ
jgi:hypothetical protein